MLNEHKQNRRGLGHAALLTLVVGSVVSGLVVIGGVSEPYGVIEGEGVPPVVVDVIRAHHAPGYEVARRFVGTVEARRQSRVGFELGGLVTEVLVDDGGSVKEGDAIARLDTSLLESQRAERLAARDQARAAKELAELTRKRRDAGGQVAAEQ